MKKMAVPAAILLLIVLGVSALLASAGEEVLLEEAPLIEEATGITPDSPLYVLDTFIDDITLATKSGSDKAEAALRIKNERIAEAGAMVDRQNAGAAVTALENAEKTGKIIEEGKFSPGMANSTEEDVKQSIAKLQALKARLPAGGLEGVEKAINVQLTQEEKIRAAKDFIKTIGDYCEALAYEDFELLDEDETCMEEKAPDWLKEYIDEDLKEREGKARAMIVEQVTTCVLNPRECDCSKIPVKRHQYECQVNRDLAIKCEYENDLEACGKLSESEPEKPEDLPPGLAPIFESTMKEAIAKKEKEMFAKMRPPECSEAATPRECYDIMNNLYGKPFQCDEEGLSDDECFEWIKKHPPKEGPGEMPPECKEAGVKGPKDCAKIMFEKYGTPPFCEGLSFDDCVKESMKQGRGEGQSGDFPPECKEAGVTKPQECFELMTEKYGKPPECEGLSSDECFKIAGRRGGQKLPQECEGIEPDKECKQKMMQGNRGQGLPEECRGISAEECFGKMKEKYGVPEECRNLGREECEQLMRTRGQMGRPGSMPPECEGLSPEDCFSRMASEGKIPECKDVSEEECRQRMGERREGFNDCQGLEGDQCFEKMYNDGRMHECEGISIDECRQKTRPADRRPEPFADDKMPPECEGLSKEECMERMKERREGEWQGSRPEGQDGWRGGPAGSGNEGPLPGEFRMPPECEGLSREECMKKFEVGKRREGAAGERHDEPGDRMEGGERRDAQGRGPMRRMPEAGTTLPVGRLPGGEFPTGQPMPGNMPTESFPRQGLPSTMPAGGAMPGPEPTVSFPQPAPESAPSQPAGAAQPSPEPAPTGNVVRSLVRQFG
ncbi:hypothetical protein HYY74_00635 [Candidatus Woesearchaeota archaeon]|nr:hypothetical protein [Candidatus Woesearchaeota archaeon]